MQQNPSLDDVDRKLAERKHELPDEQKLDERQVEIPDAGIDDGLREERKDEIEHQRDADALDRRCARLIAPADASR